MKFIIDIFKILGLVVLFVLVIFVLHATVSIWLNPQITMSFSDWLYFLLAMMVLGFFIYFLLLNKKKKKK